MANWICWLLGHKLFVCKGCQQQMMSIFEEGEAKQWVCETEGCQGRCERCRIPM